jgi:hypothetical protein
VSEQQENFSTCLRLKDASADAVGGGRKRRLILSLQMAAADVKEVDSIAPNCGGEGCCRRAAAVEHFVTRVSKSDKYEGMEA